MGGEDSVIDKLANAEQQIAELRKRLVEQDYQISSMLTENARLSKEGEDRLAKLEKAYCDLAVLDQLKSDFLALISHELRTPLTTVMGYTDLVLRGVGGTLTPKQSHHLKTAHTSARELLALIDSLIEFSILEAGRDDNRVSSVDLGASVELAIAPLRPLAIERGIALRNELCCSMLPVKADEPKLRRAIESVLSNSIKFTPSGGSVTLSAFQSGGRAVLRVEDTGIGVPPEELDKIWGKFYQVDSSPTRKFGGLGLGLAIAKKLLELQDGRIFVESTGADQGTVFNIEIPLWEP